METQPNYLPTEENAQESNSKKERVALITGTQMERPLRYLAGLIEEYVGDEYEVDIINLGTPEGVYEHQAGGYPEELVSDVLDFIKQKKPAVVGITMIDYGVERLSTVIRRISEDVEIQGNGTKIVAGGPFAIEHAERCIQIPGIDVVCYATGWNFANIVEASKNGDLEGVPGLMIKKGVDEDGIFKYKTTPPPNLRISISDQPLPDESYTNTYRIHKGYLVNASESGGAIPVKHHQFGHKHTGILVTSEGCPNECQFCSVPRMQQAIRESAQQYAKKDAEDNPGSKSVFLTDRGSLKTEYTMQKVRFLDPARAIEVIQNYLEHNPKTEYILFNDNDFAARPTKKLQEFCELYKAQIGLPFYCQCSPNMLQDPEKIAALRNAGMDTLDIGVQGSEEANRYAEYNRNISDADVLNVAKYVAPFLEKRDAEGKVTAEGVKFVCDFINGNEIHTKADMLSTLNLVKKITQEIENNTEGTGSWNLAIHNLTLDADVKLAELYKERQSKEGMSVGEVESADYHNATIEAFYKLKEPYMNILLQWMAGVHDQTRIGQLQRKTEGFLVLVKDILEEDLSLRQIIEDQAPMHAETADLLSSDDVYNYLSDQNNDKGKEILKRIHSKLGEVQYSYQEPDRYEYDESWADTQLVGKPERPHQSK